MRRAWVLLTVLFLCLWAEAGAVSALSLDLYTSAHFSFAVPEGWKADAEEEWMIFRAPDDHPEYAGAMLTVEEADVSDYVPFEIGTLYQGFADGLAGETDTEWTAVSVDGHAAGLVALSDENGCLCTVLYCRGTTLLAMSATAPGAEVDAVRTLLLNCVRYTAYLGN